LFSPAIGFPLAGIQAAERCVAIAHLRRQHHRQPFADVNDGLASFTQPAEPRGQTSERGHDNLISNLLHGLGRRTRVLLFK